MAERKQRVATIHDPRYRKLVAYLISIRENLPLKQAELAGYLGLTQPDISKIERLERRIDALELIDWLKHCKSSLTDLDKKLG